MPETSEVPTPAPETVAWPVTVPPKKTQEEVNVEVYEEVFKKCMAAAARIIVARHGDALTDASRLNQVTDASRLNQVKIASAIFDRFYNDQTALKAGGIQAKAMIEGMTQVLEGRR